MNVSPYIYYTTKDGMPGVKVRKWHPVILIPNMIYRLEYWITFLERYRSYESTLREIYRISKKSNNNRLIRYEIQDVDCGYGCDYDLSYGFVPECGCPIHD